MYIVKCDKCNAPVKVVLKGILIGKDRVGYFTCEECGRKYISYVKSPAILSLIEQKKKIAKKMGDLVKSSRHFNREYERLFKKYKTKENKLNILESKLKQKYEVILNKEEK